MARKSSSSAGRAPKPAGRRAPTALPSKRAPAAFDDGILESDSEEDEFADYKATSSRRAQLARPSVSDESGGEEEDYEEGDSEAEAGFDDGFDDSDAEDDGGGVGMYEPDAWDGGESVSSDSGSEGDGDDDDVAQMRKLRKSLDNIPLETLRKAQRVAGGGTKGKAAPAESGSESDGESEMTDKERKLAAAKARLAEMQRAKGKGKAVDDDGYPPGMRPEHTRERKEIEKRSSKHAPTVMSTKKQVSRSRQVIDLPSVERRDPRFSSLSAGKADADLHARGYSFLPELQKQEVDGLRQALAAALKAERTCKLIEKPRFTAAREGIERELARARSKFERTQRETRERKVLADAKRAEREKRAEGKGAWYMKKSEKRDLLLRSKFESLEAEGGKRAVKKAMDKKLKKVAGKEKKSRPFAAGGGAGMEDDRKRRRVA